MKTVSELTVFLEKAFIASGPDAPIVLLSLLTIGPYQEGVSELKPETFSQVVMTKDKAREIANLLMQHVEGKAPPGSGRLN